MAASTRRRPSPAADGSFTVDVPITGGVQRRSTWPRPAPTGATAHATRTVVFDFVPGTVLLDVTDPDNDDNGPGNYAYPTSDNFHAGALDMQRFQVFDDGTNIIFRVQNRNQAPTFGSPLGAQLIDVYVHDPAAAADVDGCRRIRQRNFQIAPESAWSKLIQVQGFGQRFIDAGGATARHGQHPRQRAVAVHHVQRAEGRARPAGPGLDVHRGARPARTASAATRREGSSATPQQFQFGVCATASADPHCTFDPGAVPKVIDVLTPPGVLQSDELDYTLHTPVTITGVTIP